MAACLIVSGLISSAFAQTPNNNLVFSSGYYDVPYVLSVADVYNKGTQEPLGTINDGFGMLGNAATPGLETLFPGRVNRDTRVADFNNDGLPDIISNTYSCVDAVNHPADIARVYLNNGDGSFTEVTNPFLDQQGNPIELRGRGETIVVADFNNDGYLDAFLPYYTSTPQGCANSPQSYLLINDGTGHFTDVAVQARVSLPNQNPSVEGAQALDFNNDGWIDLYGSGHLFINMGGRTGGMPFFLDFGPLWGLPTFLDDEGAKFIDADNDGTLALTVHDPSNLSSHGPALYTFHGSFFSRTPGAQSAVEGPSLQIAANTGFGSRPRPGGMLDLGQGGSAAKGSNGFNKDGNAFPMDNEGYSCTFGMNAYDVNNDGLDDIVVREGAEVDSFGNCGSTAIPTRIFLNQGPGSSPHFQLATPSFTPSIVGNISCPGGAPAFGDFNNDGKIDVVFCTLAGAVVGMNQTPIVNNNYFVIEVLGPNGQRNQQGRVVQISPLAKPSIIYTRVVDSGSGYLSQNQYPLLVGSRYGGMHIVSLSLPSSYVPGGLAKISFMLSPGQKAQVYAPSAPYPTGKVVLSQVPSPGFSPALFQTVIGSPE